MGDCSLGSTFFVKFENVFFSHMPFWLVEVIVLSQNFGVLMFDNCTQRCMPIGRAYTLSEIKIKWIPRIQLMHLCVITKPPLEGSHYPPPSPGGGGAELQLVDPLVATRPSYWSFSFQ